jgi:tripartite-type tricarboxylate transporter receptor subunit TctC
MDIYTDTPEHYRTFLRQQIEQWAPVIKRAGIKAE